MFMEVTRMAEIVSITAISCITLVCLVVLLVPLGIVGVLVVLFLRECPWMGIEDELDHREPQEEIEE